MSRQQQSGKALGSAVLLTIDAPDSHNIFTELWRQINTFEQQFSRFIVSSELSKFNQAAGQKTYISPEFKKLLSVAIDMSYKTDGLYNPLLLPALQKAGYVGSWPLPTNFVTELDYSDRELAEVEAIEVGDTWAQIAVNTALDFGGCGKGYLLDQLASYLDEQNVANYWLSLGGDIICSGNDQTGEPWQINIEDAREPGKVAGEFSNNGKKLAVATSGVTKRKGQGWHHIIDPTTGEPAKTDVLTASLATTSATEADVFAKCLVILGSKAAKQFIKSKSIRQVLVQTK